MLPPFSGESGIASHTCPPGRGSRSHSRWQPQCPGKLQSPLQSSHWILLLHLGCWPFLLPGTPNPPSQGPSSPIALCHPPRTCHCCDTCVAVLLMRLSAPQSQGWGPPGHQRPALRGPGGQVTFLVTAAWWCRPGHCAPISLLNPHHSRKGALWSACSREGHGCYGPAPPSPGQRPADVWVTDFKLDSVWRGSSVLSHQASGCRGTPVQAGTSESFTLPALGHLSTVSDALLSRPQLISSPGRCSPMTWPLRAGKSKSLCNRQLPMSTMCPYPTVQILRVQIEAISSQTLNPPLSLGFIRWWPLCPSQGPTRELQKSTSGLPFPSAVQNDVCKHTGSEEHNSSHKRNKNTTGIILPKEV